MNSSISRRVVLTRFEHEFMDNTLVFDVYIDVDMSLQLVEQRCSSKPEHKAANMKLRDAVEQLLHLCEVDSEDRLSAFFTKEYAGSLAKAQLDAVVDNPLIIPSLVVNVDLNVNESSLDEAFYESVIAMMVVDKLEAAYTHLAWVEWVSTSVRLNNVDSAMPWMSMARG